MSTDRIRGTLERWYSVQEVADALGVSVATVRRFVRQGKIGAVRTGHLWRIPESSLTEFRERNTHVSKGEETAEAGKGALAP